MSFLAGLTLVFIHLKLSNQIDWSWWFIWSPFLWLMAFNAAEKLSK